MLEKKVSAEIEECDKLRNLTRLVEETWKALSWIGEYKEDNRLVDQKVGGW